MKASAVADAPPVISSMIPRSQVTSATVVCVRMVDSSSKELLTDHRRGDQRCREEDVSLHVERFMREEELLYDLRCSLAVEHTGCSEMHTSLQTNSSSGSVVNMFNPKQKRATLIRVSF